MFKLPTTGISVQAVDGFKNVRRDRPVVIQVVASDYGEVYAEVSEGLQFKASATGMGYTNTVFVVKSPQIVVKIVIPTGKVIAKVVNGFGRLRYEWPVKIVRVTHGHGETRPLRARQALHGEGFRP